ncbi:MAG: IscA/HesB family protein [Desulfovibrionaceae bacterium]
MIDLTDAAKEKLGEYFDGKEVEPIRIYLAMGCGGPQLALALDSAKDTDEVAEVGGFKLVVDKKLYDEGKPFVVDAGPMGFTVQADLEMPEMPEGSGGCGSCCGSCSC